MPIKINEEECEGCGTCLTVCTKSAIVLKEAKGKTVAEIVPELCDGCAECAEFCFRGVIKKV